MKRNSVLGLILIAFAGISVAQDEPPGEPPHANRFERIERLEKELNLNDQQKKELEKIFAETRPQLEALRKQMQELRQQMRGRIKAVLSPEQMEKFDKLRSEQKGHQRGRRWGRSNQP